MMVRKDTFFNRKIVLFQVLPFPFKIAELEK